VNRISGTKGEEMTIWKRDQTLAAACCGLGLVVACSSSSSGGSVGNDAGVTVADAGSSDDASTSGDAETPTEAGVDGSVAMDGSSADAGSLLDAAADSNCDVTTTAPDFTQGSWLICDALTTNGRIWNGTLTITSETPTCGGATITGAFHWVSTNMGAMEGDTLCQGSYVAGTQQITLDEYQVTGGTVGAASDFMKYDPGSDQLVNGGWTCGAGCPTGMWSAAPREARDAGAACPGDF
jgi:hypothetical protein